MYRIVCVCVCARYVASGAEIDLWAWPENRASGQAEAKLKRLNEGMR